MHIFSLHTNMNFIWCTVTRPERYKKGTVFVISFKSCWLFEVGCRGFYSSSASFLRLLMITDPPGPNWFWKAQIKLCTRRQSLSLDEPLCRDLTLPQFTLSKIGTDRVYCLHRCCSASVRVTEITANRCMDICLQRRRCGCLLLPPSDCCRQCSTFYLFK